MRDYGCKEFARMLAPIIGIDFDSCYKVVHRRVYLSEFTAGDGKHRKVVLEQRADILLILLGLNRSYNRAHWEENLMRMIEILRQVDEADPSALERERYQIGYDDSLVTFVFDGSILATVLNGPE